MKLVGELTQQHLKSVIEYIPICGLFLWTGNYPGKRRGTSVNSLGQRRAYTSRFVSRKSPLLPS